MLVPLKRIELLFLAIVIVLAVFLRFWQLRDYVVFLGDEGRDMLVMRKMIIDKRPTFLGPTASVGGFYLGPIYYWMAAPFLFIWRFDPVGPSYFVAVLGVATVFLLYKLLKETVGFGPAILASFLYATAPLIVRYSRSSWNPNVLPFFALLLIYFLYLGITRRKLIYFLLAGASFGITIQLHYLSTILLVIGGLIVVVNMSFKKWHKVFLVSSLGFLLTFSPFLIFEIKNHFPNFTTISEFVTRGTTLGFKTTNFVWLISNLGNILLEELTKLKNTFVTKNTFWILTLVSIYGLLKYSKETSKKTIFSIGLIWFIGGLLGLRFYTGQVFDYYFGFMFPAPFLLTGLVFYVLWHHHLGKAISILVATLGLVYFSLNGFYRSPPNRMIDQTETVADFVIAETEGKLFNFALISDYNSDHAYRYFLGVKGHKPTELETLVTEQLLVVCESKKCAPLGHPIWEIAGFGRGEIAGEWELPNIGIRVFRLTHWPGAPNPAGKPAVKGQ